MSGELIDVATELLDALDRGDTSSAAALISSDAQGIDEVSRSWIRGSDDLMTHVRHLTDTVRDLRSEMHDVHEVGWADTGIVTFWLEQDLTIDGKREHVSAPTTYVLRRVDGRWKLVLGHSVPLPPA